MAQIIGGNFAGTGSIVPTGGGPGMMVNPDKPLELTPNTASQDTYTGAPLTPNASTPAKEPAVVSSSGAKEQIANAQDKLTQMSTKGTTLDPASGMMKYADGSGVPEVAGATYNPDTGKYEPTDKSDGSYNNFYGTDTQPASPEYQQIESQFAPLKANLDAGTLGQVNSIEQQFQGLKATQQDINAMAAKSAAASTITDGSARYAPVDAHSVTLASISKGLGAISDLDAQENAAIAKANNAGQAGDDKLMTQMSAEAETIRKEKQSQADKVMTTIQQANKDLQTQRDQMQKDNAVAAMMASGETDPAKIMAAINKAGLPITADEVKKSLTALTPTAKTGETYKFTQSDVGKMLAAGMTTDQIQKVQDHYNGNGDAPALDDKQVAAVQQALSGVTPKAGKADTSGGVIQSGKIVATQADIDQGTAALKASASQGPQADGKYADPNVYLKMYEHWMNSGGKQADFFKYYPFTQHINPANTWLAQSISDFNKTGSSSGEQAP